MRMRLGFFIRTGPVTCLLLLASCVAALAQNDKYACSELNPQSVCNAATRVAPPPAPARWTLRATTKEPQRRPGSPAPRGTAHFA
jgi:hypothetical protein